MINDTVLDLLKTSAKLEIENKIEIRDDCIEITLPNGEVAILIAQTLLGKSYYCPDSVNQSNNYVCNHNYGNIGENRANKLLLRNLQDVKAYAIDVAQTNIIDAVICGDIIRVSDELAFQITVKIRA